MSIELVKEWIAINQNGFDRAVTDSQREYYRGKVDAYKNILDFIS